jgi:hypothetical protein
VVRHVLNLVALGNDQSVISRMLDRMAGKDDGVPARVLSFATPVSGASHLVPALGRVAREEG